MDIRKEQHMKKIDLIENQKYNLEDVELEDVAGGAFPRLPIEKKNNRCCPKCGKFLQVAVLQLRGRQRPGAGCFLL